MELSELMRLRGAKQAYRINRGSVEVASGDGTVLGRDVGRIRKACSSLGDDLQLGRLLSVAMCDGTDASLLIVEEGDSAIAVVELAAKDELDAHAHSFRDLIEPPSNNVVGKHQGFLEVKRDSKKP